MTVTEMTQFLRQSLNIATVSDEETGETLTDSEYLKLTDEDIKLVLNVAMSREYSLYGSIEFLPEKYVYPTIILAKKELYFRLATSSAPLYDLGADNNNYLKKSQRFSHYMKCIEQCDKEYQDYLNDNSEIVSSEVYIASRNGTRRNFCVSPAPIISLNVCSVTCDTAELCWEVNNLDSITELYLSKTSVHDPFIQGEIIEGASPLKTFDNAMQSKCRLTGLEEGSAYCITLRCITRTGKFTVTSQEFMTLTPESEEEVIEVSANE